ncbi:hypothetical protein [Arthrobacter sp. ISL-65]|uniref:hypothetical protein n=1 Tax=Arthrobacter sp. ISL-65 TaxID=2819112 RepID=UPI001BEABFE0|nr:hypothetical protein [Arthrobacter sp. ISL-65]MBT2548054.1 hypothetical protein [Arthrobacter sp. ISL-65]
MHTSDQIDRAAQARHLQETLLARLARGREWATPGIEVALRRALTGIDTGLETASPRLQASLRTIADELAGRVEAATPRLHERIARLIPEAEIQPQGIPSGKAIRKLWWFLVGGTVGMAGGLAVLRAARRVSKPEEVAPAGETAGDWPPWAESFA